MQPILWGPSLWQALFSCAWTCKTADVEALRTLLLHVIPMTLPCAKCRQHFVDHLPIVHRRARGEPKTPDHAFRWLWYLKDEVNKTLGRTSVPLSNVTEKHVFHGGIVDDVALGDTLVLVALDTHTLHRDDLFLELCTLLVRLLPLPKDSEMLRHLAHVKRPIVPSALRVARGARVERGLKPLVLAHYKAMAD